MPTAVEYAVREHWDQLQDKIIKHWGLMTEEDVASCEGNVKLLVGKIHDRTGKDIAQIEADLEKIIATEVTTYDQLKGTAQEYADQAAATAQQYKQQAAHAAGQYTDQARAAMEQGYDEAAARFRQGYNEAEQAIRKNPLESILTSFGTGLIAGVVVGLVLHGRR